MAPEVFRHELYPTYAVPHLCCAVPCCVLPPLYRYMAPEVFRHELYNHKVDQYAFAMICYQLFQGQAPYNSLDPVQAARAAATMGARPEWIMAVG